MPLAGDGSCAFTVWNRRDRQGGEAMVRSNLWRRKDLFDRSPPFDPSRSGSAPFTRVYRPNGEHLAVIRPLSDSQSRMPKIGRASGRERVGQSVEISVEAGSI